MNVVEIGCQRIAFDVRTVKINKMKRGKKVTKIQKDKEKAQNSHELIL